MPGSGRGDGALDVHVIRLGAENEALKEEVASLRIQLRTMYTMVNEYRTAYQRIQRDNPCNDCLTKVNGRSYDKRLGS